MILTMHSILGVKMNSQTFQEEITRKRAFISDGATGTNLIAAGLERGKTAEHWVLERPEMIANLHADFIRSGADIILTCTFGASELRLKQAGLSGQSKQVNEKAVQIAKEAAAASGALVAGSIGPLGEMLKPLGTLTPEDAEKYFAEQAEALISSGVDLIIIETQFDLSEARAAVQGVQSVSDIAVICSFSFDRGTRTMMGVSPSKFVADFTEYNLAAFGINCGKSLHDNLDCLIEMSGATDSPIWFKPNAGLPELDSEGRAVYSVSPEEMGKHANSWLENGAKIVGGCCGTTPDHLKFIAAAAK